MISELFPFQKQAVNELRLKIGSALGNYQLTKVPQVISLQAPTGSGKTIIMSALIEDILYGGVFPETPNAIFVWLSDSPQLNEQSKQKIELKADRISMGQCVVIDDASFDQEVLSDGKIYFLNTQKLGKAGNLGQHSDTRQYTIWETIENTARTKSDRLYFIIDEAHRGMQGRQAGTATTIMQRFLKGSPEHGLHALPLVIGMSATAQRFNALVGDSNSTLNKVSITPAQVRASGLLKDRIIITYPEDSKYGDMTVLQAATDEWIDKCKHWYQYTYEQHYQNVNPVFVIQVAAGSTNSVSSTNLEDVIAKIEERLGEPFKENEVVHTFGSANTLTINGLNVPHIEASEIAEDRRVRVVLFKENLSTGWDCPRAETMMSFRHAEDATYIAQLLGRMIRTPLQMHVQVDDSLNDVRLFLPYFNKDTVQDVIAELQNAEGGEIPTEVTGESMGDHTYVQVSVHTHSSKKPHAQTQIPGQTNIFSYMNGEYDDPQGTIPVGIQGDSSTGESAGQPVPVLPVDTQETPSKPMTVPEAGFSSTNTTTSFVKDEPASDGGRLIDDIADESEDIPDIDREGIIRFINERGFLTFNVRKVKVTEDLKSLLSLAGILTQYGIYEGANDEIRKEVTDLIRDYIEGLHKTGQYDDLAKKVTEYKLSTQTFDVFGEQIANLSLMDYFFSTSESDLDRQLRYANTKLGNYGFPTIYGKRFYDSENPNAYKVDCILFAADKDCMVRLNEYAEKKFNVLNDKYRKIVVFESEKCRRQYDAIVSDEAEVSSHSFNLPETISMRYDPTGTEYRDHLYADDEGMARIKLNSWESSVLREEEARPDFVCWIRNISRQSWSLCIPYKDGNETKPTYPDFLIIRKDDELGYVMDILEPHNPDFNDNLGKAQGFAKYAARERQIGRIQLIRKTKDAAGNDRFLRLDMSKGEIRKKVLSAVSNDELDHYFDEYGEYQD